MPNTPNFGIPLVELANTAQLDTLLNSQATAIDTNLKTAMDAQNSSFAASIAASTNLLRGTAAQRAATTSKYWQFWLDTDGSQKLYVGNKTGGWRQYSGKATVAAGGWTSTNSNMAGRAVNFTLPTVILPTEEIQISAVDVGNGFGLATLVTTTRNTGNTVISVRQMQLLSYATNPLTITWNVVPV